MRFREFVVVNTLACALAPFLLACASTGATAAHGFNPNAQQPNGNKPAWACESDGDCIVRPTCGQALNKCVNGFCSYQPLGNPSGFDCPCFAGQEDFCSANGQLGISKCACDSTNKAVVGACTSQGTVP